MTNNSADLLITNGIVLQMDAENTRIQNGAVAVVKDKIVAVGSKEKFADWKAERVIDD